MNLKKAFRYQNVIKNLLDSGLQIYLRESNFKQTVSTYKKSELNKIALNKDYEDEVKIASGEYNKFNTYSMMTAKQNNSKNFYGDIEAIEKVLSFLLVEKAELTDAIDKAKSKIKIKAFGKTIGYDAAIGLNKSTRQIYTKMEVLSSSLTEVEVESTSTQKVIVSNDLAPVDCPYTVINKVEITKGVNEILTNKCNILKECAEDISNQIEAAALSTEVKYEPSIKLTETVDSLYNKFVSAK